MSAAVVAVRDGLVQGSPQNLRRPQHREHPQGPEFPTADQCEVKAWSATARETHHAAEGKDTMSTFDHKTRQMKRFAVHR